MRTFECAVLALALGGIGGCALELDYGPPDPVRSSPDATVHTDGAEPSDASVDGGLDARIDASDGPAANGAPSDAWLDAADAEATDALDASTFDGFAVDAFELDARGAPDVSPRMPDVGVDLPDVGMGMRDVDISMPDVGARMPDVGTAMPDAAVGMDAGMTTNMDASGALDARSPDAAIDDAVAAHG